MKPFLKKHLFSAALLVAVLGMVRPAAAHHLWLYASRYDVPRLATARQWGQWKPDSIVLFGYGDYYPLHDLLEPERVASFTRYSANGDQQPVALGEGSFLASPLTVFVPGAHIVAAELHPRFVSRVGEEHQHHYLFVPKDEVMEGLPVIRSYVYHNYAKALFQVGPSEERPQDAALLARPLGHTLEIVLLSNPRTVAGAPNAGSGTVRAGVDFAVLFEGQPLADVTVRANHLGLPASAEGATALVELDEAGRGRLTAPRAGVWQLHLTHRIPAPPELSLKAAALTYSASFTFEVPAPSRY
ncbi:hypothetical protein AXK11_05030 [Cephaloticoccus primus]|uniref:DUF4198 domain-containing protein n=1 Tax=Cephaloticoccus primus TaxID=1548207 RepID=A0A139SMV1_9BACT|nr:DUF4198 domain-containing protein [Cephaloticoccus primus]KXU35898.1 hypothetical protein AXK11_05030 [Cephaloticoccus primus]